MHACMHATASSQVNEPIIKGCAQQGLLPCAAKCPTPTNPYPLFWTFTVSLTFQFLHKTIQNMMMYHPIKFGCQKKKKKKQEFNRYDRNSHIWLYEPSLWPWPWRWQTIPFKWYSGPWWCVTVPSLVNLGQTHNLLSLALLKIVEWNVLENVGWQAEIMPVAMWHRNVTGLGFMSDGSRRVKSTSFVTFSS